MGNSTTAGRSSARGKANRYQRTQPPQRQHHPPRQRPSQSQRGSQNQQNTPSRISPNLAKRHRRLPSQQQQQIQQGSEIGSPPAKRRRINSSATESKLQKQLIPQDESDASSTRPPVKLSVTEPHGRLHRTTNGVRTTLHVRHDDVVHDGLMPSLSNEDKRVLRSQGGGPRSTSDLVQFFPDYEEYVFGNPKQQDFLSIASTLYVTDEKRGSQTLPIRTVLNASDEGGSASQPRKQRRLSNPSVLPPIGARDDVPDLSAFEKEALEFVKDPLPDSEYLKAHKRGERNEKQMRNVEKERAMHEKSELERLYDELRGADWLKAMGISGITETEKRQLEPKRDYYIVKVKTLLCKFEKWRDKEKEMKVNREKAVVAKMEPKEMEHLANAVEEDYATGEGNVDAGVGVGTEARTTNRDLVSAGARTSVSTTETRKARLPRNAKAEQNDKQEVRENNAAVSHSQLEAWNSAQPLTSFYAKSYEREAAHGKHRRGGRHVTAFGQAMPVMSKEEFDLPEGFLSTEEMRDHARKRRRDKRESLRN